MWRKTLAAVAALVVGLALVSCGDDDGGDTAATTAGAEAEAEAVDSVDEFCATNEQLIEVRSVVYGQPFEEGPEEIEALLAESDALFAELEPLTPEDIPEAWDRHTEEFVEPIDGLTEANGWDPFVAINTPEATAIFNDPDIQADQEEIGAWLEQNCPNTQLPGE